MSNYLLFLPIIFPILIAFIIRISKLDGKIKEKLNLIAVIINSILVLTFVIFPPSESFCLLNLNEKLSFTLALDGIGRIFAGMVAILWPFAYLYVMGYMAHEDKKKNYAMFYVMTFGVVLGISFSANLVTMYFFYELLTFITLPLIMYPKTKEAKRAGRFYLYISLFGSTLALVGIIILVAYFNMGSFVNVFDPEQLQTDSVIGRENTFRLAYLLTFLGFGVKSAIFPLHGWLPKAGVAPTPTTALLHAVAVVKSGAFAIIRVIYSVIGIEVLKDSNVQIITMLIASFTIVFGSAMAMKQLHVKRRFAYSTISNISYILLAATMMSKEGLYAAMLHLIFHSFAKISIFFIAGETLEKADVTYVDQMDGFAKKMPITFACFILAGLSIVGIPGFAGFISKYEIINSAFKLNTWYSIVGVVALLISALLTACYVLTIVIRAYFKKPCEYNLVNYEKAKDCNYKFIVPIATFAVLSLLLGIFANPILNLISNLLGGII